MKIDVFRCDHTQKIFFGRDEYRLHLRDLAEERIAKKKSKKAKEYVRSLYSGLRKCSNFPEIANWIEQHAQELREAAVRDRRDRLALRAPFYLKDVRFQQMQRTRCPVNLQKTGWRGTIYFEMHNGPSFDIIRNLPIETGSGSGAFNKYGMEVYFWDDDWPSMAVMHRMQETAHLVNPA
jgi:hypothetical protein